MSRICSEVFSQPFTFLNVTKTMQLEIQSIHFKANDALLASIHEKFDRLEHKDHKIESCHIVLKKEKTTMETLYGRRTAKNAGKRPFCKRAG